MSQPTGIILKAVIEEGSWKKYLRKESVNFARLIFADREAYEDQNFYLIRYYKPTATLYCFLYFYYGNAAWLDQCPHLVLLRRLEDYLQPQSTGYLLGTLDSLSPADPANKHYFYTIQNARFTPSPMTTAYTYEIEADSKKFFKAVENGLFFNQLHNSYPIIPKNIKKQYEKLVETHRRKVVMENLDRATPDKPLKLFGNWYYNGQAIHYGTQPCPGLDVYTFRETPYGGCDDRQVAVETIDGLKIMETDPAAFRKLHKGFYTTYFKTATTIYDEYMKPIPQADAATFKLLEEFHAKDKNNVYTFNNIIPLSELGEPYYFDDAYFFSDKMLIGTKQIWIGKYLLRDVDAATFRLLPYHPGKEAAYLRSDQAKKWYILNEHIKHGTDKDGEFFICINEQNTQNTIAPIPEIPELPFDTVLTFRTNQQEFEQWYVAARRKFLDEAEKQYKKQHSKQQ